MEKNDSIRIVISQEKKKLWQDYCAVTGLTLTRLIEQGIDDIVCGKMEFKPKEIGDGWYWNIKPRGAEREKYDRQVLALGRENIERIK